MRLSLKKEYFTTEKLKILNSNIWTLQLGSCTINNDGDLIFSCSCCILEKKKEKKKEGPHLGLYPQL
jgi:hypothetical protein